MWLENCLRAKPVVDFDPESGHSRPVGLDELPEGVALIHVEEKLHGSYLDESDAFHVKFGLREIAGHKKFFHYWMPKHVRFFFQDSDGVRIEIDGKRYATLEDARDAAGHPVSGHMEFSIHEPDGRLLYRHVYDQTPYLTAYMMDFSFPEPELADWDFFAALKGSFDYMRENAHKHHGSSPVEGPACE